jgi:hypothetical protein
MTRSDPEASRHVDARRTRPAIRIFDACGTPSCFPNARRPPRHRLDGVPDASDNCPFVPNPAQEDCNSDGVGDACELDCNSNGLPDKCEFNSQIAKLTASDAGPNHQFGYSVALSGDTAVVGAPGPDWAYVFVRTGGVWTQQQKLIASDVPANRAFGYSVAVSGDTAVVGAIYDNNNFTWDEAGAAYVFTRVDGVWTQQQKLTASGAFRYDYFGSAVAVSGDTAVIGSYNDGNSGGGNGDDGPGSAYVFTRTGGVWSQQGGLFNLGPRSCMTGSAGWSRFRLTRCWSGRTATTTRAGSTLRLGVCLRPHGRPVVPTSPADRLGRAQSDRLATQSRSPATRAGRALMTTTRAGPTPARRMSSSRTGGVWTQQQKLTASDARRMIGSLATQCGFR